MRGQALAYVSKIAVGGFKCLDRVEISPLGKINVLTGRNNTGKSAVLQMAQVLPTGSELAKNGQWQLPAPGIREQGSLLAEITTVWSKDDLMGFFRAMRPDCILEDGSIKPHFKDVCARIEQSGVFGRCTWVFAGKEGGASIRLAALRFVMPGVNGEREFELGNQLSSIQMPNPDELQEALNRPDRAELPWEHPGRLQRWLKSETHTSVPLFKGGGGVGGQVMQAHIQAIKGFLDHPRYRLAPQRRANPQAQRRTSRRLNPDGSNLAQRLETLKQNRGEVFERVCRFMRELVPGIGNLETPYIDEEADGADQFRLAWSSSEGTRIPLSESGTGIEQLLMLGTVLFAENQQGIVFLEEPENHLHPGAQEHLMRVLNNEIGEGHAFVATHSPVVAQPRDGTTLVSLRETASGLSVGQSVEGGEVAAALRDLGVKASHFLLADVLVLAEGITAVPVIEEWLTKWPDLQELLDRVRIVVSDFNAEQAGNRGFGIGRFLALNRNVLFVADRDEKEDGSPNAAREALERKCKRAGVKCVILQKVKCLERLFTEQAIQRGAPERLTKGWIHDCDSDASPFEGWLEHVRENREAPIKEKKLKKRLKVHNRSIAAEMTCEELVANPDTKRILKTITQVAKSVAGPA